MDQLEEFTDDQLQNLKNDLLEKIKKCDDDNEKQNLIKYKGTVCRILNSRHPKVIRKKKEKLTTYIKLDPICYSCLRCDKNLTTNKIKGNAFCLACSEKHSTDLCEIITGNENIIYKESQLDLLEEYISKLEPYNIRLDLHGVVDTFNVNDVIVDSKICVISFVGKLTKTRIMARKDIEKRIETGQVHIGFLIFKRGKKEHADYFHEVGSKTWLNSILPRSFDANSNPKPIIFVDDSHDHYNSVKNKQISNMTVLLHKDEPKDLIKKLQQFLKN